MEPYNMAVNTAAFALAKSIASPALTSVMASLSESFLLVLPLLAIYMFARRDKNVYTFVVAVVLFYIISDAIKYIVREPRPCSVPELSWINAAGCESSYSFPSNHATVLTGLPAFLGRYRYVRLLYVVWLLLVLFGRVYLGAHYLTDVIAGVLISIIFAYILYRYRNKINSLANKIVGKIIPFLSIK
ncbi:MAG: phosphatase PAP2 family protein [Candidatus Micrarchaeaceae archaeon]